MSGSTEGPQAHDALYHPSCDEIIYEDVKLLPICLPNTKAPLTKLPPKRQQENKSDLSVIISTNHSSMIYFD